MKKRHVRAEVIVAAALLIIVISAMVGCSKRQSGRSNSVSQGASRTKATGSTGAASPATGTIKLSPVAPGQSGQRGASPSVPAGANGLQGPDRLLAMRGGTAVFPADYDIGSLQPSKPAGTEQGAILRVIQQFFDSLAAGKIDTELLAPEWRNDLVRLLRGPQGDGNLPQTVRVGLLTVEQGAAHAAIRIEKGAGSATGQVYLERSGGTWYISDIQADFSELARPSVRSELFDPAEWKAMIKE